MKNLLLAAGSEKNVEALSSMVRTLANVGISSSMDTAGVKSIIEVADCTVDAVIINAPLSDGKGIELAAEIVEKYSYPVLLLVSAEAGEKYGQQLTAKGVIVLSRPLDKKVFQQAVKDILALSTGYGILRAENKKLQDTIEEIRLVNRAKAKLIEHLRMTEAQAHRYIEKQAMDLRLERRVVAQSILKTYYNG